MHKLTLAQQQELEALKDELGAKVLILAAQNCVERLEQSVINLPVNKENVDDLVHRKLRAEGAKSLLLDITRLLEKQPPKKIKSEPKV